MTDRERIIYDLARCTCHVPDACRDCSKYGSGNVIQCMESLMMDTLELLKEQEPVKAVADGEGSYMCNNCGTVIGWDEWEPGGIEEMKYKFCPECGRAVKWDD